MRAPEGGGHPKRYLRGVPHGEGMVWFFIFPFSVQSRRLKTLVANYWTVVSDPPGWPSVRALAIAEPCSIIRGGYCAIMFGGNELTCCGVDTDL